MIIEKQFQDGLTYKFLVKVPPDIYEKEATSWLIEKGKTLKLKGFRPGKVPLNILKKHYQDQAHTSIDENFLKTSLKQILKDYNLKQASPPHIERDDKSHELSFTITLDTLPPLTLQDFKNITLKELVVDVTKDEVENALSYLHNKHKAFEPLNNNVEVLPDDSVEFSLKAYDQNKEVKSLNHKKLRFYLKDLTDQNHPLNFLYEELLKDKKDFKLSHQFSKNYGQKDLSGKKINFEITNKIIYRHVKRQLDNTLAKDFNLNTLDDLRQKIKENLKADYQSMAKIYHKRHLLDALDKNYNFEVPKSLVDKEFKIIWHQLEEEYKKGKELEKQGKKSDFDAPLATYKEEYTNLAKRRVKLGLVVSEIAKENKITLSSKTVQDAVIKEALKYPGQEEEVIKFYRQNLNHIDQLTGPILEDMVIDFIFTKVNKNTENINAAKLKELLKDILPTDENLDNKKQEDKAPKNKTQENKIKKDASLQSKDPVDENPVDENKKDDIKSAVNRKQGTTEKVHTKDEIKVGNTKGNQASSAQNIKPDNINDTKRVSKKASNKEETNMKDIDSKVQKVTNKDMNDKKLSKENTKAEHAKVDRENKKDKSPKESKGSKTKQ